MQERPLPQWLLNLEAKKRARRAKDVKRKKNRGRKNSSREGLPRCEQPQDGLEDFCAAGR
jgi:hypothetical protein